MAFGEPRYPCMGCGCSACICWPLNPVPRPMGWVCPKCGAAVNPTHGTCPSCTPAVAVPYMMTTCNETVYLPSIWITGSA